MLRNLSNLLKLAQKGGFAVACFNVFGYEDAKAVVAAAEQRGASVILSINLDMREFMPLEHIASMLIPLAESSTAPVCLHLDHTYDIQSVKRAIDCGFSSVMYDGSQLSIQENVNGIQQVVEYATSNDVSVEAEVGSVPYASGRDHIKSALTEVDDALAMQELGRPHALAVSVGNVHRIESGFVTINFEHFQTLRQAVDLPLVIHGTSGIEPKDIQTLVSAGACKFNIGTNLRKRFGQTIRDTLAQDPQVFDRLTIMKKVIPEVSEEASAMIDLLGQ